MPKEEKHSLEKPKKYKIIISKDALWDIKSTKKYILDTFKYREYAENFSKKIKKAIKELDSFPKGYEATGYVIEVTNMPQIPMIFRAVKYPFRIRSFLPAP